MHSQEHVSKTSCLRKEGWKTNQGLDHVWVHLADAGCHKGAIGVTHNAGLTPTMLAHKLSHSMRSIINLASSPAKSQRDEIEFHQDYGMRGCLVEQHAQEADVWKLQVASHMKFSQRCKAGVCCDFQKVTRCCKCFMVYT